MNGEGENTNLETSRKAHRGRGKATGELKLSAQLLDLNANMQKKFILLREAIFVPAGLTKMEGKRRQRAVLAKILGVHEKLVHAIEKTHNTLPATVIFKLMEYYNLPLEYFTTKEATLSEQFIIEQKLQEFDYKLATGNSVSRTSNDTMNPQAAQASPAKKGGWMKGLPRKAKSDEDLRLLEIWREAKKRDFTPKNIDDLLNWANNNNIDIAMVKRPDEAMPATNGHKRRYRREQHSKRGGWMRGLPRQPKTDEQKEQVRIWQISRELNLKFNSVKELMAWWATYNNPDEQRH